MSKYLVSRRLWQTFIKQPPPLLSFYQGPRKIDIDETDRKLYCACSANSRIVVMNLALTDNSLQNLVDTTTDNVEFIATIPK